MRRIRWRGVVGAAAGRGEQAAGGGEASSSWFSSCRAGLQVDAAAGAGAGGGGPIMMTPDDGPFMNGCDMGSNDDGKMLAAEGWSANGISGGRDGFHVDDGEDDEDDDSADLFFLLWWLLLDLDRLAGGGVKTTDGAIGDEERCAGAGRMGVTLNGTPSLDGRGRFPATTT